ncbi:MAG: sigma-70 family RNA polymerase sigma factor [Sediminibacterium sp.]|nr:sigma-70 family RNA polymerase sigma factor [Sediminibacterium sp.]
MNRKEHQSYSDEMLLEKYYEQYDNYWLGILLPRYTLLLLGVCMKYLKDPESARDMLQQVFMKCMTELPRHRVEFFKAWIYQVTRNDCLMYLRKKKIKVTELADQIPDELDAGSLLLDEERQWRALENAILSLNQEQKTCIQQFYLQKKSYLEITKKTGYSLMQVKSYIQNGKRNLKIELENKMKRSND